MTSDLPIGVFDSGVGGLTVLRALRRRLPAESLIYLGDTARVPYGTKSVASIVRYAAQATDHLVSRGVKMLVVACNTASAVSIDPLRERFAPLPVIGVVEPGAEAAVAVSRRQHHLVLATESTVRRHAYAQAIARLAPGARVDEQACSLFVALAEEGWTDGEVPDAVARTYLAPRMTHDSGGPDTIVLGCTHFPLLHDAIRSAVGPDVAIVDSATTTAEAVARVLAADDLLTTHGRSGALTLLATDGPDRFAAVGARFLGEPIGAADVEVVDL
ncbi:MAG: glutamate racemase [Acidobacteria bacterium SCN 69-37]|nr:MAG: glutamate racemase [Acidobacteria bacterium SCN 69-37]